MKYISKIINYIDEIKEDIDNSDITISFEEFYYEDFIEKINKTEFNETFSIYIQSIEDILESSEIKNIINNMPENLTDLEKAYYLYIELGKLINYDPRFLFVRKFDFDAMTRQEDKISLYDAKIIPMHFYAVCYNMSELYVRLLSKLNIEAKIVKVNGLRPISHAEALITIDGKYYLTNLCADLNKIKIGKRVRNFGTNLNTLEKKKSKNSSNNGYRNLRKTVKSKLIELRNKDYFNRLTVTHGELIELSSDDLESLDRKVGYCLYRKEPDAKSGYKNIYTNDTLDILKKSFRLKYCPEKMLEYFKNLKIDNKDCDRVLSVVDIALKKIQYYVDSNDLSYVRSMDYMINVFRELLTEDEFKRLHVYKVRKEDDGVEFEILSVKSSNNDIRDRYFIFGEKGVIEKKGDFINLLEESGYKIEDAPVSKSPKMYSEDFIEYVLNGQNPKNIDVLKYKLDYLFQNIDKLIEFQPEKLKYSETMEYMRSILRDLLEPEELKRISSYVLTKDDDRSKLMGILKIKPKTSDGKCVYYLFDKGYFKEIDIEELQKLINASKINKPIGKYNSFNDDWDIDELFVDSGYSI